jgi:hypothetical protein
LTVNQYRWLNFCISDDLIDVDDQTSPEFDVEIELPSIQRDQFISLKNSQVTRWNSKLAMLESVEKNTSKYLAS